ncbi:helix-turn-helix transcriptional regulator [Streptomyces radicis]|uniref:XRE family transcriptional regulator n=1 Tax=Streptomyces radicis TaxID=1750517 RepID=A0A3A9VTY4_9ACTN|nr:helix-turn-helix transcriptional regulator [Streptomyces radicis]RKN04239.1 XRE family transcriptional regulator [Streptomyces radicis]RKN14757.1 XRE family transcriptional regulator [Streptomyces radicis]
MNLGELGAFLRTRRSRVRPDDVGLKPGPRRRVPGLRRDEVAHLAGVSVDYYTELERGRGARPSEQMLRALARALRLSQDEHDHLFHLAGRPAPSRHGSATPVEGALLALLDRLDGTPAQIITDLHEPLIRNGLAVALLGRVPGGPGRGESLVHRWFTQPRARACYVPEDHAHHSRVFVADLRAVVARRGRDQETTALVAELRRRSPEFATLWDSGDVAVRRRDRKRMIHPALGLIEVDCHRVFSEDGRQRLVWFTSPPDAPADARIELLSAASPAHLVGPPVPTSAP